MLLPSSTADASAACCDSAGSNKRTDDVVLLSEGLPLRSQELPLILHVSAVLSSREKWLFWLTNVPYFLVVGCTFSMRSVDADPIFEQLRVVCTASSFHGSILLILAIASAFWHGAQLQIMPWLYCRSSSTGMVRLHSPRWLRRLIVTDVSCSSFAICCGLFCFGPVHTLAWLAVPVLFFLWSAWQKRLGRHRAYALGHGLWHVLSAIAISQIVFNKGPPLQSWTWPCGSESTVRVNR